MPEAGGTGQAPRHRRTERRDGSRRDCVLPSSEANGGRRPWAGRLGWGLGRLGQAHVYGLEPLRSFLKIELHSLALFERAESVHLDCGVVHEYIGPAIRL